MYVESRIPTFQDDSDTSGIEEVGITTDVEYPGMVLLEAGDVVLRVCADSLVRATRNALNVTPEEWEEEEGEGKDSSDELDYSI